MAKVDREACFYYEGMEYQTAWQGKGWARIPVDWLFGEGELRWVISLGKLRLRILNMCGWELYVVQENWRWPLWWVALRIWLMLCWFERNLRMTAAIWGLLHRTEPGCMPFWSDFIVLHLLRRRKVRGPTG